jgi:hypothetical protein
MITEGIRLVLIISGALSQIQCGPQQALSARQIAQLSSGPVVYRFTLQSPVNNEHIRRLIARLSSKSEGERVEARTDLVRLASESPQNRAAVIDGLIRSAETLDLKNKSGLDIETFEFWAGASQIFSRLKAAEAIDLLIGCINCNCGIDKIPEGFMPAQNTLIEMGTIAVPKLSEALLHDDSGMIRGHVALCLGSIGGPEAKHALERAKQSETNKDVIHTVDLALSAIARRPPRT